LKEKKVRMVDPVKEELNGGGAAYSLLLGLSEKSGLLVEGGDLKRDSN
jgi:hypothetical protein